MSLTTAAPATLDHSDTALPKTRVLLVDDSDSLRTTLTLVLEQKGFEVAVASNVNDALKLIAAETFDVLLSDLQMPNAGDGLTVVSAMRHSNPGAVTLIFSGFPAMDKAANAILLQTDRVLTKPMSPALLVKAIKDQLRLGAHVIQKKEDVSTILESETQATISEWRSEMADSFPASACSNQTPSSPGGRGVSCVPVIRYSCAVCLLVKFMDTTLLQHPLKVWTLLLLSVLELCRGTIRALWPIAVM